MQAFYSKIITVGFEISTQNFLRLFSFRVDEDQGASLFIVSTCVIRLFTWTLNLEMIISERDTTGQFFASQNILFYMTIHPCDVEYSSLLRNIVCPGNFAVILLYFAINLCRKPVEFCQQHVNKFCKIKILMLFA
jgi:hypothetical protein